MIVEISGQKRNNTGVTVADKEDLTEFASIVFSLAIKGLMTQILAKLYHVYGEENPLLIIAKCLMSKESYF